MRVVIVTGGTAGLGRAMVHALLEAGHQVVAVGRSGPGELVPAERLSIVHGDVALPDDCEAVVAQTIERYGHVDVLVNNAGVNLPTRTADVRAPGSPKFYDVTADAWRAIMHTNTDGAFYMARAVTPHLVRRGWGRIINHVTSYRTMVRAGESPYGPSKAALEAMTAIWANELEGTGVTVNAILPGGMSDTRMISHEAAPDRSKLISPDVMHAPIRWLVSDASNSVTGRRVIAASWRAQASDDDNLATASSLAGWPETVANAPAAGWIPR